MRQKVLATFIIISFLLTIALPFMDLNAAELWNKQSDKSVETRKYYNAPKNTVKKRSLYNMPNGVIGQENNKRISKVKKLPKAKMGKQVKSKLSSIMSKSALANRTSDTQNALQAAYEQRQKNRQYIAQMRVETERFAKEKQLQHQQRVAQYYANKKAGKPNIFQRHNSDPRVYSGSINKNSFNAVSIEKTSTSKQKKLYNTIK